jgi:tetratricopeptide (TPR) repeat protein
MSAGNPLRSAGAAFVVVVLVSAAEASAAPTRAALERRFESAMSAGRWEVATALGDSLVRRREAAERIAPEAAAALLDSLGLRLFMAGPPEALAAAEPLFRAGLERRERSLGPDHPGVASSLATLSTLLDYLGRWADAIPIAQRAVAIRTRALGERHPDTAESLRQLGLLHLQLGEYDAAAGPLERSLAIYQALGAGRESQVADGHNNLGELARVRDRLDSAETHFQLGLEVARAHLPADDLIRFGLENNLAGLLKDIGRLDEAEPLLEKGLATLEAAGDDPAGIATARLNLAEVQRLQGRPGEAAPLYDRALEGARAGFGAGHPDLVSFLNQTAVCQQELGHFARAESLYAETGAIIESALGPDHPLLAQNLGDLARLRLASGRARDADTLLGRALALRERTLGPDHPDVALLLVDRARVRAGFDSGAAAQSLARAMAILDSTRAHPEARLDAYAMRAEREAGLGHRPAAIADMAVALAAMDSLRARRGGGDETRASFIAGRLGLIDRMVEWQIEQGEIEAALQTHERGRARVLLDQIAGSGVDLRAGIPGEVLAPLVTAERAAEARLAASQRDIQGVRGDPTLGPRERLETLAAMATRRDSAASELARARRRIEDASPLWRSILSSEGRIPLIAELQRTVVPRGGLMLVYHVGSAASHVFAVADRGRVQSFPLVLDPEGAALLGVAPGPLTEQSLERAVGGSAADSGREATPGIATLLGGVAAGGFVSLPLRSATGPDAFETRLHALWRGLVPEPLRRRLAAAPSAVIIPDGALHWVAFEALVTRPRGREATTRYWLDDGPALAYGPSATSLRSLALRPRRTAPPSGERVEVLSVSGVSYASVAASEAPGSEPRPGRARAWRPLPGTTHETEAIVAAFGAPRVEVLSGIGAREPAVRAAMSAPRYLHIATHGFADLSGDRLQAGLVLAPPNARAADSEDDGVLDLFEIHRLSLGNDLAVLSACETAKGPRVAGEGAFALARGFLAAGSRRVVASLWAVDDQPTARMMGTLFAAIASAERKGRTPDIALALRNAKRRVREDPRWADPFYWAPFVLSGR